MDKSRWNTIIHKPTGNRYRYHYKLSWGKKCFSFDDELTWHDSRGAAFAHAEQTGNLVRLNDLRPVWKEAFETAEINGWPKGDY